MLYKTTIIGSKEEIEELAKKYDGTPLIEIREPLDYPNVKQIVEAIKQNAPTTLDVVLEKLGLEDVHKPVLARNVRKVLECECTTISGRIYQKIILKKEGVRPTLYVPNKELANALEESTSLDAKEK